MTPDDPRHGSRSGYIAGCRNDCCRNPHLHYQKRSTLRRHREGSQVVPATPSLERMDWWQQYGVSGSALHTAAGLGEGTLADIRLGVRDVVYKSTEAKLLAVTWENLPDTALCNADLARARISSMMAAGHPLAWIVDNTPGLSVGGKWRTQTRITMRLARGVQTLYARAPMDGPSKHTATKARRKGAVHPLAWDDPPTPAAPSGWRRPDTIVRSVEAIDEAVVLRLLKLEKIPSTAAEKAETVRRWTSTGRSIRSICKAHGWHDVRYVGVAA